MLGKSICILLSGKAGVGKTTSALILKKLFEERGLTVVKEAFATGVKQVAMRGFNWDGEKDQKGRRLLQRVGFAGREYNENIWVESTLNRVEDHPKYPVDAVLVDDWRFPNEESFIRENHPLYSVYTIRIYAPNRELLVGTPEYNDVSETALDDKMFNISIDNTGSLEDLHTSLKAIANLIISAENNFGGKNG